jgi:deoxyribodipyrimidine photo-lyase
MNEKYINRVREERVRVLKEGKPGKGPVVYWMSRNQRARDNWALLYARDLALEFKRPLVVIFYLSSGFGLARESHYRFMLEGLKEAAAELESKGIPFVMLSGEEGAAEVVAASVRELDAGTLVVDFDPLRMKRQWYADTAAELTLPVYEVDARNVVPVWVASNKQEYAARTIRPKILKLIPEYLEDFPPLKKHPLRFEGTMKLKHRISMKEALDAAGKLPAGPDVSWCPPGQEAARKRLKRFIDTGLRDYSGQRNDPNRPATSMLSPYIHFGQISAGRIALEVDRAARETDGLWEAADDYVEELVVRRELADNYCFYNENYDSLSGFPDWGMKTLNKHRYDSRPYIYTREQLEAGDTRDDLWNTAQRRLTAKGTMHGFLRMYWAKKILEWTESPEEAMEYCLEFNDSYQLDGRDPNGYTGIAWAVGGVHDRPWKEREVFGTIRYMNYKGCKRKFDVAAYVENVGEPEML